MMIIKTVYRVVQLGKYKMKNTPSLPVSTNYTLSNTLTWMGGRSLNNIDKFSPNSQLLWVFKSVQF